MRFLAEKSRINLLYLICSKEIINAGRFKKSVGVRYFDKLEFVSYLTALTVYVAPQLFNTSTDANPASTRASSSCFTVSGVS